MTRTTVGRLAVAVGTAAAVTAGTLVVTAAPALAYNFPFPGCGASRYFDTPSATTAIYNHRDGNKLWYKIYWGSTQPVPHRPLDPANWAHCYV